MELTILMPCLNEAETLEICIKKAQSWMEKKEIDGEVLIADNGSTDGSQDIALCLGARVVGVKEKGYGATLTQGILNARGKYVIMADSDGSYDFSDLSPFITELRGGFDLVMGNRFRGGINKGAMPFLHRYFGNPVLSFLGRMFFKSNIGDFHCGIRGFRQDIVLKLKLQTTGMEFASEMVVKAVLFNFKTTEVATTLSPDGRSRKPHLRTWRDGWRHLRFLLMYSPTWLFKIPGMSLMLVGLVLMFLTAFRPFEIIKGVFFDTNTLIFASFFIILGYTCIMLGVFTRTFATEQGFLPKTNFDHHLDKSFSLEMGLGIGILFLFAGLFGAVFTVYLWDKSNFGRLDYQRTLRIVVPSATFILLGFQTLFSSFFLSILKIRRTSTIAIL